MRRLFSNFAHGPPGVGLLLARLVTGIALIVQGVSELRGGPPIGAAFLQGFSVGLGILLLAGLWTPIAGALAALLSVWNAISHPGDLWNFVLVGTLGIALTLLGPGAWSVDARIFGWKRLDIPDRKSKDPSR